MRIASTQNFTEVSHNGATYTADGDGILEVPEEVGYELTAFPAWVPEHEAKAVKAAEQAAADNDVTRLAARVADLEERLAALEKPRRAPRGKAADASDDE